MITKEEARAMGTYKRYKKTAITEISDFIIPQHTEVDTLEGVYTCGEASRLAFDNKGNVYPIANSIFETSYEEVTNE